MFAHDDCYWDSTIWKSSASSPSQVPNLLPIFPKILPASQTISCCDTQWQISSVPWGPTPYLPAFDQRNWNNPITRTLEIWRNWERDLKRNLETQRKSSAWMTRTPDSRFSRQLLAYPAVRVIGPCGPGISGAETVRVSLRLASVFSTGLSFFVLPIFPNCFNEISSKKPKSSNLEFQILDLWLHSEWLVRLMFGTPYFTEPLEGSFSAVSTPTFASKC